MTKIVSMKRHIFRHGEDEDKIFDIKYRANSEWPELWYNGEMVGKMVNQEECRRVAWSYLVNLGLNPEPLTDKDFVEVKDDKQT